MADRGLSCTAIVLEVVTALELQGDSNILSPFNICRVKKYKQSLAVYCFLFYHSSNPFIKFLAYTKPSFKDDDFRITKWLWYSLIILIGTAINYI